MKRRKVADVTAADVRRIHKKLADKPATADHVRTVLHAVLETARMEGLIDSNPATVVKRYAKPPKRRWALTTDELARLGKVLDAVEETGTVNVTDEAGETKTYGVDPAAALTLRLPGAHRHEKERTPWPPHTGTPRTAGGPPVE